MGETINDLHEASTANVITFRAENDHSRVPHTITTFDEGAVWRRAIRLSGVRRRLLSIVRRWVTIARITRRFCSHFTYIVPSSDASEPLVTKCLRTAVEAWEEADGRGSCEQESFLAFLRGLIEAVPEANRWCVFLQSDLGNQVWDASAHNLLDWLHRWPLALPVIRQQNCCPVIADPDLRLCVAVRILNREEISRIPGGLLALVTSNCCLPGCEGLKCFG